MTTAPTHLSAEQLAACQRLHDQLVATGPEHFNMGTWLEVGHNEYMLIDVHRFGTEILNDCGTKACIAGHAVLLFSEDEIGAAAERLPAHTRRWWESDDPSQDRWGRQAVEEQVLAELLGMNVSVPEELHTATDWFGSTWPKFAQDIQRAHYLRSQSAWGENYTIVQHEDRADHATVVQILDELVHGQRRHWWDGEVLSEAEQVESDDRWEDAGAEEWVFDRW